MAGTGGLRRLRDRVAASLRRTDGSGSESTASGSTASGSTSGAGGSGVGGSAADPGAIRVTYAPEHDGQPDPGEVVWTWVPYEDDPSQGKDRPVLLLGWQGPLLVGVQLSSKDHGHRSDAHEWLPVGTGAWDRERRPSYADASRLLRIDPATVRREGAALDQDRFRAVLARVRELHGWSA